jgi:hypothetical protein
VSTLYEERRRKEGCQGRKNTKSVQVPAMREASMRRERGFHEEGKR